MKKLVLITLSASLFILSSCEKDKSLTPGELEFDKSLVNDNPGQHDLVESSETTTFRVVSTDTTATSTPARTNPGKKPLTPGKPLKPGSPVKP